MKHLHELIAEMIEPEEWAEIRVRKDLIPPGATLVEAYLTNRELIVMGQPPEGTDHNCDAMGCGSLGHVRYRFQLGLPQVRGKRFLSTP